MDGSEHEGTCDDEGDTFAITVVDESEERGQEDRAEGCNRREESCDIGIHTVLDDHQLRGEFQEWRYSGVEEYTEECNQPETWITEGS